MTKLIPSLQLHLQRVPHIQSLHNELDIHPTDQMVRSILADAYEDEGLLDYTTVLRWMVKNNLCPDSEFIDSRGTWVWFHRFYGHHKWQYGKYGQRDTYRDKVPILQSFLPVKVFDRMVHIFNNSHEYHQEYDQYGWTYAVAKRRDEAEEALVRVYQSHPHLFI